VVSGRLVGTSHTSINTVFRKDLGNMVPIRATKNVWKEIRR